MLVVLAGCQVTTAVGVDAHGDGSGTVRVAVGLDRRARARVPNLARDLRVDDLRKRGWEIVGPRLEADGRTWIRASKPFTSPAALASVIDEVGGEGAPFRDFRLTRSRSFFHTRTRFRGTVDLGAGIEAFGDADLRNRLGGSSVGATPSELEKRLGGVLSRLLTFKVDARLPGTVTSNAPVEVNGGAEWRPKLGERVVLVASSESLDTRRVVGVVLGGVALVALFTLLVVRRLRH